MGISTLHSCNCTTACRTVHSDRQRKALKLTDFHRHIGSLDSKHGIFKSLCRFFWSHNLWDEFLLILQSLIAVRIKCTFCNIAINWHIFIFIALSDDMSGTLFQISRSPRYIQIVNGNQLFLNVSTRLAVETTIILYETSKSAINRWFCYNRKSCYYWEQLFFFFRRIG